MVTDRKIIIANGRTSLELTARPYWVNSTSGFDRLQVSNVTSQSFGQSGAKLLNSYTNPRPLGIKGQIKADTTAQMQLLRDKLINLFIPGEYVTITHYYGGKNRMINAVVENTPEFDFTEVSTVQQYSLDVTAPYPYWSDVLDSIVDIADTVPSFHFPLMIPKDKGVIFGLKSTALIANVYNSSPKEIGMKIVFIASGAVSKPQLMNINTREVIRLTCDLQAGDEVSIATGEEKTITLKRKGETIDLIGSVDLAGDAATFLNLAPGDNLFRFSAEDGESFLSTKIYYRNEYLGV